MVQHKIKTKFIRQDGHNGIRKEIEKVMKGNGWMNQVEVAEKIHRPVFKVDKVLTELEKEGLVDAKPTK